MIYLKCILNGTVILVLSISGVGKLINPVPAMQLLEKLPLFPHALIILTVSVMSILELLVALGIIFKYRKFITYSANLFLFAGFFRISVYGTYLKLNDDCGCFGSLIESHVGWLTVLRNTVFLGMAIYLFVVYNEDFISKIKQRVGWVNNA